MIVEIVGDGFCDNDAQVANMLKVVRKIIFNKVRKNSQSVIFKLKKQIYE